MNTPRVSFLVPVFNRLDLTRSFVATLPQTLDRDDWEAIIVDDGSTDGTREFLQSIQPPFRVFMMERNGGYARAMNCAAASATGDILGLLNNDLILRPGWLDPMMKLLEHETKVGAVGNIQVNPATGLLDHAGVFFDPDGMPAHARKNRRHPPRGPWRERNACTAACMLMSKEVFTRFEGFFEDYRNGMEDIDLCVRMRAAGLRILVSHESVVGHLVSSAPGRHDANAANTEIYRRRCAHLAAPWGAREWPAEYLRRYARHWWRIDPKRGARALFMLLR
ncbi:MAG: glycosyltransferase family 2 protein, partial [Opitutaceae bacterium]